MRQAKEVRAGTFDHEQNAKQEAQHPFGNRREVPPEIDRKRNADNAAG